MYIADYHSHSSASPDGDSTILELAMAAVDAGLSELCVTDHCECNGFSELVKKNLPAGVDIYNDIYNKECVLEQREKALEFCGDKIKLPHGIEIAQGHAARDVYYKILADNSFDFVIASLHNLRGEPDFYFLTDFKSQENCEKMLEKYLAELYETACLPGFNVLAHITYPLRYMRYKYGYDVSLEKYGSELEQIFKELVQKGCGIELNVAGLRNGGNASFPGLEELRLFRECGGEIVTIGSDAHKAEYVGAGIAQGQELLREAGFKYFAVYEKRVPSFIKL
jgi:histidinol-phosphatase (PHP family)